MFSIAIRSSWSVADGAIAPLGKRKRRARRPRKPMGRPRVHPRARFICAACREQVDGIQYPGELCGTCSRKAGYRARRAAGLCGSCSRPSELSLCPRCHPRRGAL